MSPDAFRTPPACLTWQQILCQQYEWHELPHWPIPALAESLQPQVPWVHALTDIYKCLYQGEFGIGHSISSPQMFQEILARELQRTGQNTAEPLLEQVSPDGCIVRINLRPLRLLCPEIPTMLRLLTEVCLASAASRQGRTERFLESLAAFQELNRQGDLQAGGLILMFPPELVAAFLKQVRDFYLQHDTVPVLSHSSRYRRLNQPSYRVVVWEILRQSPLADLLAGH